MGKSRNEQKRNRLIVLSERQNHKCCYCGISTTIDEQNREQDNAATIEHVKPKSKGGPDAMDNCVMACRKCNNERGSSCPYWFSDWKAGKIAERLYFSSYAEVSPQEVQQIGPARAPILAVSLQDAWTTSKLVANG